MTVTTGTVALNIVCEGLLLMVSSIKMKKKFLLKKNIPNSRLECKSQLPLLINKMAKNQCLIYDYNG